MIRVTCAIIVNEGKILVTQRGLQMKLPGLWEFPGGKIEFGETDEECILREIKEELGISVKLKKQLNESHCDYGNYQIILVPFLAEFESGVITLAEHMRYMWLFPEELKTIEWAPADVPVVDELLSILNCIKNSTKKTDD